MSKNIKFNPKTFIVIIATTIGVCLSVYIIMLGVNVVNKGSHNNEDLGNGVIKLTYRMSDEAQGVYRDELAQELLKAVPTIDHMEINVSSYMPGLGEDEYSPLEAIDLELLKEYVIPIIGDSEPKIIKVHDGYIIASSELLHVYSLGVSKSTPYLMKIDFDGNVVWENRFESNEEGGEINGLVSLSNGDIVFATYIMSRLSASSTYPQKRDGMAYLYKCDKNGELLWRKDCPDKENGLIKYLFATENDELITLGEAYQRDVLNDMGLIDSSDVVLESSDTNLDILVRVLDKDGELIKRQLIGGNDFDFCRGADYKIGGKLVITGWSQSSDCALTDPKRKESEHHNDYIVMIDEDLKIKWVKFPLEDERYSYESLQCLEDYILVSGYKNMTEPYIREESPTDVLIHQENFYEKIDYMGHEIERNTADKIGAGEVHVIQLEDKSILMGSGNGHYGLLTQYSNGEKIKSIELEATPYTITKTLDGGFVIKSIRNVAGIPQPLYSSLVLFDQEVVMMKFNQNLELTWRHTYDGYLGEAKIDKVYFLPE